ncbi:DUF2061 domain-containing protein [Flavimaricola marinus]|uniref:DUF2061 domain-containing protein n=1 Tax=Flavimaricola marinus TaxID=1819565 RepID=A0A238LGJ0_9RHOB|nr:DUF2061 domain-containing protein [Flavimaricola marinus]SMY08761.1 hypothetical protein LOM8899_02917 [Flavimaricola marinus]
MESRKRSVIKAVIWNLLGLLIMAIVGFAMTGSLSTGGTMALINAALGLTMYFLYERLWAGIRWGRNA